MTDVGQMSTDDLMALYNRQKAAPQAAPAAPDLSSMSTEDLLAMRAHQQASPAQDQSGGIVQSINDLGSNIRTGLTHGVAGLVGLPVSAINAVNRGVSYATSKPLEWAGAISPETGQKTRDNTFQMPGGISDVDNALFAGQQKVADIFSPGTDAGPYQPKTEAGKLTQDMTGAMVAPGKALVKGLAGAGSYVGGRASEYVPEQYREYTDPALRFLGGIVGGGAGAARQVARDSAAEVAPGMIRQRAQGITPEQFDEAARFQQQSPIPITTAEALGKVQGDGSPIAQLGGDVLASQGGHNAMFTPVLADRPTAVQNAVTNFLDSVGPRNVGTNQVSAQLQQAADRTLNGAPEIPASPGSPAIPRERGLLQERTAATSPSYQAAKADTVPPEAVMDLVGKLQAERGGFDPKHPTYNKLTEMINRLWPLDTDTRGMRTPPVTDVGVLDNIYRDYRDEINMIPSNANAPKLSTKGTLGNVNAQLGQMLTDYSQNLREGRAIHREISPQIDAFQASPAGRMIDANNSNPEGAYNQFRQVLNDPKSTPQQVTELATVLNHQNPNAFRDAMRLYLEEQFKKSLDRKTNIGRDFYDKVAGAQGQGMPLLQEGLEQTQGWLPGQAGARPATVTAQPLFDALESTNRIPGTGSPTATRGTTLEEAASNGMDIPDVSHIPAMAAHIASGGMPGVGVLSQWALKSLSAITGMEQVGKSLVQGRNLSKIGAILGSPDGVREVQRILAMPEGAPKTRAAAQLLFLAAKGAGQGDQSTSSQ